MPYNPPPPPAPGPIPTDPAGGPAARPDQRRRALLSGARLERVLRFEEDRFDAARLRAGTWGAFAVVDALLKETGAVFRQIVDGQESGLYARSIAVVSILFTAAYGLLMGMPAGVLQGAFSAMKLPMVFLGTWLVCLPSFYVFNAMFGSKLNLRQACLLLLCLTGSASILLIAFAPVVWFFGISTESESFMVSMHSIAILVATMYGIASLNRARDYASYLGDDLGSTGTSFLSIWTLLYGAVFCQMATYLGPLVESGEFFTGPRRLFLSVFFDLLTAGK